MDNYESYSGRIDFIPRATQSEGREASAIWFAESEALFDLVRFPHCFEAGPIQTVVEIGTCLGRTACLLGMVLEERGGELRSIERSAGLAEKARLNVERCRLGNTVTVITGTSAQVPWNESELDLLIIDGDHTQEGVDADCRVWLPRVRPLGSVAFHDFQGGLPNDPVSGAARPYLREWDCFVRVNLLSVFRKP